MQLIDARGLGLNLRVTGYQFPDADDVQLRSSWHMVQGEARAPEGAWTFHYAALTCDETPNVSWWLREVAAGQDLERLEFTEPNLIFEVENRDADRVVLAINLDLEFRPKWHRDQRPDPKSVGHPYVLHIQLTTQQLTLAAEAWDEAAAPYPDLLAATDRGQS